MIVGKRKQNLLVRLRVDGIGLVKIAGVRELLALGRVKAAAVFRSDWAAKC